METTSDNGKTVAIIAYITLIGWIIALIMNNGNKTALGTYHVRQSLGIICVGVILNILASILDISIISCIVWSGVLVLWVLGIMSAVQVYMKLVSVFGDDYLELFK